MESAQKCMIIGAAPLEDGRVFEEFDPEAYFVICADGGWETARRFGIRPDLVIGDFDSSLPPEGGPVLRLPVEKDVTDTQAAVDEGFARGFSQFVLLGGLGGRRVDHTLANLQVLATVAARGGTAVLADACTKIFCLRGCRLLLRDMVGAVVSVFPFGGAECTVSYEGLKYPLYRKKLVTGGLPMGVSNEIVAPQAAVTVHSGMALTVVVTGS